MEGQGGKSLDTVNLRHNSQQWSFVKLTKISDSCLLYIDLIKKKLNKLTIGG